MSGVTVCPFPSHAVLPKDVAVAMHGHSPDPSEIDPSDDCVMEEGAPLSCDMAGLHFDPAVR